MKPDTSTFYDMRTLIGPTSFITQYNNKKLQSGSRSTATRESLQYKKSIMLQSGVVAYCIYVQSQHTAQKVSEQSFFLREKEQ